MLVLMRVLPTPVLSILMNIGASPPFFLDLFQLTGVPQSRGKVLQSELLVETVGTEHSSRWRHEPPNKDFKDRLCVWVLAEWASGSVVLSASLHHPLYLFPKLSLLARGPLCHSSMDLGDSQQLPLPLAFTHPIAKGLTLCLFLTCLHAPLPASSVGRPICSSPKRCDT